MSGLNQHVNALLQDGRISESEVSVIRQHVVENGQLDMEDMQFLVRLRTEANEVCESFDRYFFSTLKSIVLADGRIGQDEQFYLLKMLYSDGSVTDEERNFLLELQREATVTTPEFDSLCETALAAPDRDWSVGGR